MTLKSGIEIPVELVSEVCGRYDIAEFAVFGSAARGDMGVDSDIDVMVEFSPEARVGMLRFAELNEELERLLGRRVDLVTKSGLKPWVRGNVAREAQVVFAR
jgi:predicted nucleotidyltransferase